ncbi:MAG: NAD(P)-dependent oxidoreductase [Lachnospira sp.]|nr:NAD(P)-dependent oxidoreductase [Lachnospira sp.]
MCCFFTRLFVSERKQIAFMADANLEFASPLRDKTLRKEDYNMKIGFIGLGKMGLPMAKNLCKAGFMVYVKSSNAESQNEMIKEGAIAATSYNAMAKECDVVITIVPADKEIKELYLTENGLIANAKEGVTFIDMTSAKGSTKELVNEAIEAINKDLSFVDAPVSGGVAGAVNGTLTIMTGCKETAFEEIKPVLEAMGKNIIYTGEAGTASNVKMLNQMLNAGNTAVAAEVLCMSRKLGVSDDVLKTVVSQSSGQSFVFDRNVTKFMMSGDHTPGFRLNLMKKDVSLFVDAANELSGFTPVTKLVYDMFVACANNGMGDLNYTSIHKWLEENQK